MSEQSRPRFADQVAVISGGASGLGYASAQRLRAEGARIALMDLPGPRLTAAAQELSGSERALAVPVDVSDATAVDTAVSRIIAAFGHIDSLVTSAGVSLAGSVLDTTTADWGRVLAINLTGTFNVTQEIARRMMRRRSGRIVMLASITGSYVWTARAAYAASKGGVIAFMKSCAVDLAAFGITVNAVSPGPIQTPQTAGLHGPTVRTTIENAVPMARYGTADEVASVVAFLLSEDARFVTGHDLRVDGGLTAAAILYDRARADAERKD